jgi:uncharacterized protein (TIGR02453 family)
VRFAKDKAPYKTNIGGHISIKRTGKATEVPIALYFHVGHNECFAAAGHYMMDGATLTRFRNAVADEVKGKALEKIIKKLESKGFVLDSHETSKRVPKGSSAKALQRHSPVSRKRCSPMQSFRSTSLRR